MIRGDEREIVLEQARELVRCLEADDLDGAEALISQLTHLHERTLFQELGRLTRELHEAINGFLLDERLRRLANTDIPDATERLRYVIAMTEQSANTTLTAVEASIPMVETLERQADHLSKEWQRFRDRQMVVQEFRRLVEDLALFLGQVGSNSSDLHSRLSEVLMAQGFQDLTGQIIRKVINLVQDLEDKLVEIIRLSGNCLPTLEQRGESPVAKGGGYGPVVPAVDVVDVVKGQDEVDDLLSSLGF